DAFIDQFDLHLGKGEGSDEKNFVVEGWVHVVGGQPGEDADVEIPELGAKTSAAIGADVRAAIHFKVKNLQRWSPESAKLYKVTVRAGRNSIDELMGFRTVETRGT